MKDRSSKATWDAFFAIFGPFQLANILMLLAILALVIFRPNIGDSATHWSIALVAVLIVTAGVLVAVGGGSRLKRLRESARDDRRRLAQGLPLDKDEEPPASGPRNNGP
ncbi:hypothetical protein AR689_12390 [Arthrobacter sp. EpRS71]|nr:hypothetical protein AR689_12390 [Arthrobacter sp. EpRS71]